MKRPNIKIDGDGIAEFCRRHYIRKLAFFGSILRSDFRPDRDVDVLVEFEAEHVPGFFNSRAWSENYPRYWETAKLICARRRI